MGSRCLVAGTLLIVNPVIAMLLGVSLGGEIVTTYEWLAAGGVALGVTVLVLARR